MATCQICGRIIKDKQGVIAHHGYTRPGDGWQTSSCSGARYPSYQESRECIGEVIPGLASHIARVTEDLAELQRNPPETLEGLKSKGYRREEAYTVTRPEGFNPERYYSSIPYTYENLFSNRVHNWQAEIKHATNALNYLKARYAKWAALEIGPDTDWPAAR